MKKDRLLSIATFTHRCDALRPTAGTASDMIMAVDRDSHTAGAMLEPDLDVVVACLGATEGHACLEEVGLAVPVAPAKYEDFFKFEFVFQ